MDFSTIDTVVGIDPGKGGAIAMWRDGKITAVNMPKTLKELNDYLHYIEEISVKPIVFIEHVQARPSDMIGGKGFGIIKMLKQYNEVTAYIKSNHLPLIPTYPISWQSKLKIKVKGEDYDTRKKRFNKIAKEWHPEIKVTLKNCDSLLLLRFGRFMLENNPDWVTERFPEDYELF